MTQHAETSTRQQRVRTAPMFLTTPFHAFLPKFTYLQKHGVNNMFDSDILIPSVYIRQTFPRRLTGQFRCIVLGRQGAWKDLVEGSCDLTQVSNGKAIFRLFLNPLPYTTHKPSPTHRLHTAESHAQYVLDFAFPLTWASFGHSYSKYSTCTPRDVRRWVNPRRRCTLKRTLLRDFFDAETQDVKSYEQKHKAIYSIPSVFFYCVSKYFSPTDVLCYVFLTVESCVTKLRTAVLYHQQICCWMSAVQFCHSLFWMSGEYKCG